MDASNQFHYLFLFFIAQGLGISGLMKAATLKWKLRLKEGICFAILILFFTLFSTAVHRTDIPIVFLQGPASISAGILIFIFFYKINKDTLWKSIVNFGMVVLFHFLAVFTIPFLFYISLPNLFETSMRWYYVISLTAYMVLICFINILARFSREMMPMNRKGRTQLAIFNLVSFVVIVLAIIYAQTGRTSIINNLTIIFIIVSYIAIYIYIGFINIKAKQKQREADLKNLENYTNELEQQQAFVRKFRHDYLNILLSLESFIIEEDLAGLKKYYEESIARTSDLITKNNFTLDRLQKIKVREIKSILISKVMIVQNLDSNVKAVVEVNEEIEHIPVSSIALVRMLGIILDNAIEAIEELLLTGEAGELYLGVFKWEGGITFIIENSCNKLFIPLVELWKQGVSTKGKGRGLGLLNLAELAESFSNVSLGTTMENGKFRQELLIEHKA